MKRTILLAVALAALSTYGLKAQGPQLLAPPNADASKAPQVFVINLVPHLKDPIQQLQAIKAANQAALDKQAKTLQALDELQKQADELKIFGKRS